MCDFLTDHFELMQQIAGLDNANLLTRSDMNDGLALVVLANLRDHPKTALVFNHISFFYRDFHDLNLIRTKKNLPVRRAFSASHAQAPWLAFSSTKSPTYSIKFLARCSRLISMASRQMPLLVPHQQASFLSQKSAYSQRFYSDQQLTYNKPT